MNNQYLKGILPAMAVVVLLSGCGNGSNNLIDNAPLISKHYKDGFGRDIQISKSPTKVVSLSPHVTETMFAIGASKCLVARSHDSNYPPEALDIPKIQTYPDFDLPTVAEYNPDMIFASGEIHDIRIAPFFEKYHIPIMFQTCNSVEDVLKGMEVIGEIVDHEKEAQALTDSLRKIGQALADSTKHQIPYGTVMIVSVDPLTVAGGLSFQNDMLKMAGAKNVFESRMERFPVITGDDLIRAAPEYVLLPTNDNQAYSKLLEKYPEVHMSIPASELKHIFQVSPEIIMTPGPRIMEGLAYLIRVLHARINVDAVFEGPDTE